MFNFTILILAISILANEAAVLRTSVKDDVMTNSTEADILTTTVEPELELNTTKDQEIIITTPETLGAVSRDEEATIWIIDQTLLDSAPAELSKPERPNIALEKSGKLLLLSTPKIAEKSKQPEENLEEDEDENEMADTITQFPIESTTVATSSEEFTTTANVEDELSGKKLLSIEKPTDSKFITKSKCKVKSEEKQLTENSIKHLATTENITKLYPINDTLYTNNKRIVEREAKEIPVTINEYASKEVFDENLRSLVLEDSEADYVLVESETLKGSYTNVDSELHLQPIVQSVEIVPSTLDDSLLINYVPAW